MIIYHGSQKQLLNNPYLQHLGQLLETAHTVSSSRSCYISGLIIVIPVKLGSTTLYIQQITKVLVTAMLFSKFMINLLRGSDRSFKIDPVGGSKKMGYAMFVLKVQSD